MAAGVQRVLTAARRRSPKPGCTRPGGQVRQSGRAGQAFNFDLLEANWNAGEFLRTITDNLSDAQRQGSSTTWVLSNHDVIRHATR